MREKHKRINEGGNNVLVRGDGIVVARSTGQV